MPHSENYLCHRSFQQHFPYIHLAKNRIFHQLRTWLTKKREVKVYKTDIMHKVHADNDSSYYLADIVVCERLPNCLVKTFFL